MKTRVEICVAKNDGKCMFNLITEKNLLGILFIAKGSSSRWQGEPLYCTGKALFSTKFQHTNLIVWPRNRVWVAQNLELCSFALTNSLTPSHPKIDATRKIIIIIMMQEMLFLRDNRLHLNLGVESPACSTNF